MKRAPYDKVIDTHKVFDLPTGNIFVYVDFHIMNEQIS